MNENILDNPQDFKRERTPREEMKHKELLWDLAESEKQIKRARIALWILIGVHFIGLGASIAKASELSLMLLQLFVILVLVFAVVLSTKNPFEAFALALVFYLLLNILASLINPMALYRGFLFKLIILGFLGMGAFYGKEKRRIHKLLAQLE